VRYEVWRVGMVVAPRTVVAANVMQAAKEAARLDDAERRPWPARYEIREAATGRAYCAAVARVSQPQYEVLELDALPMDPAVHVLWGGAALCEDQRLAGVRDWPAGQRWVSLSEVAKGAALPTCARCRTRADEVIASIRDISSSRSL